LFGTDRDATPRQDGTGLVLDKRGKDWRNLGVGCHVEASKRKPRVRAADSIYLASA
jgi:hypothetical protein